MIVIGGIFDILVVDEVYYIVKFLGNDVDRIYDVGVVGIYRFLNKRYKIDSVRVIVVVVGMEGVFVSVIGGLVDVLVIVVLIFVGYGVNFGGLVVLLVMLNSCVFGIFVVNIDNGFGVGYLVLMINKL